MHVQHSVWALPLPSCPTWHRLRQASEIFQRVMSQMVEDIDGCEAVMDDIVGKDQTEHDQGLKKSLGKGEVVCSEIQQRRVLVSK